MDKNVDALLWYDVLQDLISVLFSKNKRTGTKKKLNKLKPNIQAGVDLIESVLNLSSVFTMIKRKKERLLPFFSPSIHVLLLKLRPITHISNYQVRQEDKHVKRTVLKGVVGTLDLSVRCLLHGETFPGV